MSNKEIANTFQDLAKIMELHDENPFKIRSYQNAYLQLRKLQTPIFEMSDAEITGIKGVGKTIAGKIRELEENGELSTYAKYREKTPEGVRDLLTVKGFGPKKIRVLWKELGVESVGELLYACNENRLIELKGFGHKTQEDLRKKLEYFQQSRNKFHYASLEPVADTLEQWLTKKLPNATVIRVGDLARLCPVVASVDFLIANDSPLDSIFDGKELLLVEHQEGRYRATTAKEVPVHLYYCSKNELGSKQFRYSSSTEFIDAFLAAAKAKDFKGLETEQAVFDKAGLPYILPELRENAAIIELAQNGQVPAQPITEKDIKGVIHAHSTYSDGIHTLEEMAAAAHQMGYQYLGMTDHSKSAFYANGLKPDRVLEQFAEIDALNQQYSDFRIFKGIESDILNDGSLDYEEDLLKQFDFIIASVHSNLKMEEQKATHRLIKAIENPYTTILGHPTGRLLLSRKGYPIDHKKVIDACAANGVVIELNANPYRLDLDWSWIPYALEKNVDISVNPDAHSTGGIRDIHFGVLAARKGRLTAKACFNALSVEDFARRLHKS
ncbi:MAG: PHP domain-containing protein [Bacteroidota bacterium]